MQILQHYYTSFINGETGNAGFQVKALSPELSPGAQSLITSLIAYRIPPALDERALATHPVALRYFYENSQQAYLLCSQSNGPDENGRPGNFFAHTLVLEPEDLKQIPPVFYWASPLWQTKDRSTRVALDPLPPEQMISTLEIEGVWIFLEETVSPNGKKRLEYFPKLMAAVIQAHRTQRRIVIIDSAENVALWTAAISCMLPPDYRPLLSFATYHHDPYQSPFLITGTTSDSVFRATADEYITFFILNTESDRVSDVDPSPYAEEAARAGQSMKEYELRLLSLFSDYARRFPSVKRINEQLDQLVRYAHILDQPEPTLQTADLEALDTVLPTFDQYTNLNDEDDEDIEELRKLHEVLEKAWTKQRDKAIEQARNRNVRLCQTYKMPTDKLIMTSLQYASLLFWTSREAVEYHLASVCELYRKELFEKAVNSPEYWRWLDQKHSQTGARQLTDMWTYLGPIVRFESIIHNFLFVSLQMFGKHQQEEQGEALHNAIASACTGREEELLCFVVDHYFRGSHHSLSDDTLIDFYCHLVYTFDFQKRTRCRARVQKVIPAIAKHELIYQIRVGAQESLTTGLQEFEHWIAYARRSQITEIPSLINEGLGYLQTVAQRVTDEWEHLARCILASRELAPLPENWENELVPVAVSNVSLRNFPEDLDICEKYYKHKYITTEQRIVMRGLLAMKYGRLSEELSANLLDYFKAHPEQYKEEADSFVQNFFGHPLKEQDHNLMVNAVFTPRYADYFWHPYWEGLYKRFADTSQAEQVTNVLKYWFSATPQTFEKDYILQYFFLHLPGQIDQWQKERGFPAAAQHINRIIAERQEAWHPLLQPLLASKKNLLASAGRNIGAVGLGLATQLRRRLDSQYANQRTEKTQAEQQWRAAFSGNIAQLFKYKDMREAHRRSLQHAYQIECQEFFWECYWQHMTDLFLSQDAALMVDLLAFWFEDGYSELEQQLYLVPAFFLGFADAIDRARKERRFGECARQVHECAQKDQHFWYRFVEKYFIEPERKGLLPPSKPRTY